jgi:hypothetical protein
MDARRSFRVVSAPGQAAATGRDRLELWKEIAAYLKRGGRTVQRWEAEEGLPVHRLQHDKLGSIYAYTHELDQSWSSRAAELDGEAAPGTVPAGVSGRAAIR